jgi:hypothetical protein
MMYFRNVVCTVALATLASAAVAKQIPTHYSREAYEDAVDDGIYDREAQADPVRTAAWAETHGGPLPSYHYGEEHDAGAWRVARDAEAEPGWRNVNGGPPPAWLASLRSMATSATAAVKNVVVPIDPTKHHGPHRMQNQHGASRARDVNEEDDDGDLSGVGYDQLMAHDIDLDIPDFRDQEVNTSLEGLLNARHVDTSEELEEKPSGLEQDLTGYDEDILQRRNDGTEAELDYSLQGMLGRDDQDDSGEYSSPHHARDLADEGSEDYDTYLRSEEHGSMLESIGVTMRDITNDIEDEQLYDEQLFAREALEHDEIPDFGGLKVDTSLEGLLNARGVDDDLEIPHFDGDVDTSLEGMLDGPVYARSVKDDDDDLEIPHFDGNVDTSLEGMLDSPIYARNVDEEGLEDADDVDDDAGAAYAEVVEELVAPPER